MLPNNTKQKHAIVTIVTANYIAEALTLYSYAVESNPETSFLVILIGERESGISLCNGPEWIWWDRIFSQEERTYFTQEYTPFELSCSIRGKVHNYLATTCDFDKWIILDTDIGIFASLNPIWQALDTACIALTAHSDQPVSAQHAGVLEGSFLKGGLFNGGVLAMKKSNVARQASEWLHQRLVNYGHCYFYRSSMDAPNCYDFEFVDQIWLNLLFVYFRSESTILDGEICNLGHWNMHQGNLEKKEDKLLFNGKPLIIAHFSGLPSPDKLGQVSTWSQLYIDRPSPAWASIAEDYLQRLEQAKSSTAAIPYPYAHLQPIVQKRENQQDVSPNHPVNERTSFMTKAFKLMKAIGKPQKIRGYLKHTTWKISERL